MIVEKEFRKEDLLREKRVDFLKWGIVKVMKKI